VDGRDKPGHDGGAWRRNILRSSPRKLKPFVVIPGRERRRVNPEPSHKLRRRGRIPSTRFTRGPE
jgi:hypothetical protein